MLVLIGVDSGAIASRARENKSRLS